MIIIETYTAFMGAVLNSWHLSLLGVMVSTAIVMWARRVEFSRFGPIRLVALFLANTAFFYMCAILVIAAIPFILLALVLEWILCSNVRRTIDRVVPS